MSQALKFKLYLTISGLEIPERKSEGAAGYDLPAPTAFKVEPKSTFKLNLGFKIDLPHGILINLYMRSGLALRKNLQVVGKKIFGSNEDLWIEIRNNSDVVFEANKGDRIGQMVFQEAYM